MASRVKKRDVVESTERQVSYSSNLQVTIAVLKLNKSRFALITRRCPAQNDTADYNAGNCFGLGPRNIARACSNLAVFLFNYDVA